MSAQEDLIYPVSLVPPDISSYRIGNKGVDYIHQFDSGKSGPHVMISSVVHGNELCGAIAVDYMLQNNVRPLKGKLSLAFMNVDAYLSFDLIILVPPDIWMKISTGFGQRKCWKGIVIVLNFGGQGMYALFLTQLICCLIFIRCKQPLHLL